MTITSTGTGAYRLADRNQFVSMRGQLDDLQRQLATQKKSETYAGLGMDRGVSLDLNNKLSTLDGYLTGIQRADVNLKLDDARRSRTSPQLAGETRERHARLGQLCRDARPAATAPQSPGRGEVQADARFAEQRQVNGRYLFSGPDLRCRSRHWSAIPLIMDGDGAGRMPG
jgi:flagellar hook-associated protein 3 FlgL